MNRSTKLAFLTAAALTAIAPLTRGQGTEPPDDGGSHSCVAAKAYGQLDAAGQDLARYGKTLSLRFSQPSAKLGRVQISGGHAGGRWGLLLGAMRAELELPWKDTLLAQRLVAIGQGSFDGAGRAVVSLNLEGVQQHGIESAMQFFMQAISLDAQGAPQSSHGLAFSLCGSRDGRDTGDIDEGDAKISYERYTSHQILAQVFKGVAAGGGGGTTPRGWRATISVRLPDAGFELFVDDVVKKNGTTYILMGVIAPSEQAGGGEVSRSRTAELGLADPGKIHLHVADRAQGAPGVYKFAGRLR